jgi:hypothetical protein
MVHEDIQQLATGPRELRKFGLMVGGVLLLLGGFSLWRHGAAWPWLVAPGTLLVFLGFLAPVALKQIYVGWMVLAFTLGLGVSTVLLTLFFFLVVTPIARVARLCGKDFLSLRLDPHAKSYWLTRDRASAGQPADYEQQF